MAPPPPPPLGTSDSPPDELIEEILLRLPPDEPSCLLRASLVCKPWRRIISHRRFRRRLHELHGRPPILGFLRNNQRRRPPVLQDYVATTASAFSLAVPGIGDWKALDCRHGRALLLDIDMDACSGELVLWDPITGDQERVPVPEAMWNNTFQGENPTAAIVCAAAGCDHCGCHARPFRLVIVFSDRNGYQEDEDLEWVTWACSYSSETGEWGDVTKIEDFDMGFGMKTTSVLYFMSGHGTIIEYDLAEGGMPSTISPASEIEWPPSLALILTEDGGLGVAEPSTDTSGINIWSRVVVSDGNDTVIWVKSRFISLENLLPASELWFPMSFAERANVLFIRARAGIFTVELQSEQVRKVCEDNDFDYLVPIESFYTPRVSRRRSLKN